MQGSFHGEEHGSGGGSDWEVLCHEEKSRMVLPEVRVGVLPCMLFEVCGRGRYEKEYTQENEDEAGIGFYVGLDLVGVFRVVW